MGVKSNVILSREDGALVVRPLMATTPRRFPSPRLRGEGGAQRRVRGRHSQHNTFIAHGGAA